MRKNFVTLVIIFSVLINTTTVFASQYIETNDNQVSFSVRAVLPDNQFSDASFFEIEMEAGQVQDLEVIITNSSDEEIEVVVEPYAAATNSNGIITYDGSITEFDDSMEYSFSDIAEVVESPVVVPSQSEVSSFVTVEAPKESFDGQILGGLRFQLVTEEAVQEESVSIQQEFAYIIGVNITEKGNTTEVEPVIELNKVNAETINYQDGLQTTFINPTPVLIRNLIFEGSIYPTDDTNEVIYSREVNRFSVAPHNVFNFPIIFEEGNLIAGDYVFRGTASNEDYNWEFEKEFTIE